MEHMPIIEQALGSKESQEEALKIVLSLSNDTESLKLFAESKNIIRKVIELSGEESVSNLALQVMINLSQNEDISKVMVKNGGISTLFDFLKTHLKPDEKDEKSDVGYISKENVYEVKHATTSSIPLVLMALTNLTTYPFGREKLLNASDNPDLKMILVENLVAMTGFFKDQDLFNFGANVIANSTIDAEKNGLTLASYKPLLEMISSIKKSPTKRMKVTEAVKNLIFTYNDNLQEIKDLDVVVSIGTALIETNVHECAKAIDEDIKLHPKWIEAYENRENNEPEIGPHKDDLNHCLMDCLVLLGNEEDMLNIMNDYGIQNLFEILNFQKYVSKEPIASQEAAYQSFMGDTQINEKVTVVLNQIISILQETPKTEEIPADQEPNLDSAADKPLEESKE